MGVQGSRRSQGAAFAIGVSKSSASDASMADGYRNFTFSSSQGFIQ
jgi:hypothetical protein